MLAECVCLNCLCLLASFGSLDLLRLGFAEMSSGSSNSESSQKPRTDRSRVPVSDENQHLQSPAGEVDLSEDERRAIEDHAVKTFAFEVSAGRKARAEDAEVPLPPGPKPLFLGFPRAATASSAIVEAPQTVPNEPVVEEPTFVASEHELAESPLPMVELSPSPRKSARRAARLSAWWATSLGIHLLLLLCLTFSTLVVLREDDQLEFYASPTVYETPEELTDVEIDLSDDLEELEESLSNELMEPAPDTAAQSTAEPISELPTITDSLPGETAATDARTSSGELGQLFGESGSALTEVGGKPEATTASFFGTKIKARRILYMLDNSGGMRHGGKFEALAKELQASVESLGRKQQFYIIFYSDTVYPLFFPRSVRRFVPPSDRNKKLLNRWLDSVELCTGNAIDEALAAANVIRPDVVFLLTDGNLFTTEEKKDLLLNPTGRAYVIHTFGLGVNDDTKTADGLKQVAEANGGAYHPIKISEEMKALEKEKQRPYHSKKPGAVWGLKVGSR